jgi:tRNA A37 threonylcarbamoyladenosine modification protein TsaB
MEQSVIDIFLPVMESSIVLAAHYANATGRKSVIAKDMRYGMMYAARYVTGKQIGSMFPEVYDEESDSEDEEEDEDENEEDEQWIRYTGTDDEHATKMNECADSWESWEPESPAERALKNAVNKAMEQYV